MPEETAPISQDQTKTSTLSKEKTKTITFSRTKFIVFSVVAFLLLLGSLLGSYFLGQVSMRDSTVVKKDESKDKTAEKEAEIPDLITAKLGDEVKAKNGIAIELEEAKHDQGYEKQKEESRKYYEKNSSQSAYLDSEYFKQSNLILKIAVKNTTDKVAYYSPSSFRLKDSRDNQYTSGYGYEGSAPSANTSTLNISETTKLSVSYIVPSAEKEFTLIYENVVIEFNL